MGIEAASRLVLLDYWLVVHCSTEVLRVFCILDTLHFLAFVQIERY